jgi:hypothetical protein
VANLSRLEGENLDPKDIPLPDSSISHRNESGRILNRVKSKFRRLASLEQLHFLEPLPHKEGIPSFGPNLEIEGESIERSNSTNPEA